MYYQWNKPLLWAVGIAVASDTRDLQLEFIHRRNFIYQLYNRKDKIKEKEAGNCPSLKKPCKNLCPLSYGVIL